MRSTVNSVDFYSSLPTTTLDTDKMFGSVLDTDKMFGSVLDTDKMFGSVTVQCCDNFDSEPNCEAVEIEISATGLEGEVSFFSTLNYDNALFLANSILKILEIQKSKL